MHVFVCIFYMSVFVCVSMCLGLCFCSHDITLHLNLWQKDVTSAEYIVMTFPEQYINVTHSESAQRWNSLMNETHIKFDLMGTLRHKIWMSTECCKSSLITFIKTHRKVTKMTDDSWDNRKFQFLCTIFFVHFYFLCTGIEYNILLAIKFIKIYKRINVCMLIIFKIIIL